MIVITFLIGVTDFTSDLANLSLVWHSRNTEVGLQPDIDISDPFEPEHSISIGYTGSQGEDLYSLPFRISSQRRTSRRSHGADIHQAMNCLVPNSMRPEIPTDWMRQTEMYST